VVGTSEATCQSSNSHRTYKVWLSLGGHRSKSHFHVQHAEYSKEFVAKHSKCLVSIHEKFKAVVSRVTSVFVLISIHQYFTYFSTTHHDGNHTISRLLQQFDFIYNGIKSNLALDLAAMVQHLDYFSHFTIKQPVNKKIVICSRILEIRSDIKRKMLQYNVEVLLLTKFLDWW